MRRIAALTLLVVLSAGWPMPTKAQGVAANDRQDDKLDQKQQKALYKYQKSQEKAQQKAQRKADKQQQKEAKKYDKEQRKLLKDANRPEKRTS
jgi:hypothetical protein